MKKIVILLFVLLSGGFFSSCNDFLDEAPDNRTEIDSKEKVRQLLASAYPQACYAYLTEMMSDNTDESTGVDWTYTPLQKQAYEWGDITPIDYDSPQWVWELFYNGAAAANAALDAIEKLDDPASAKAQKGEALLCRAYAEFVLVNLFSKPYGTSSESDMGVPYPLKPQTQVGEQYDRSTVAKVYELIEKDIEEALPLIDDNAYPYAPKYHFTHDAAYAFAARFNLYYRKYDKVIEYANEVLGEGAAAASRLRNWAYGATLSQNNMIRPDWFCAADNNATLLNIMANSDWAPLHSIYAYGTKYVHSQQLASTETLRCLTPWGNMQSIARYGVWWNPVVNKIIIRKYGYYFEYSDPVAGIGEPWTVQPVFTTDELLMCRAEAYILKNNFDKAVDDMNMFVKGYTTATSTLTKEAIIKFYNDLDYYTSTQPTPKKALNPDFTIAAGSDQENLLHALLYLRRIVTVHDGLRWFDVRRYGIEISRRQVGNNQYAETDVLKKDDPRRTLQLPNAVIAAGLPKNPR
jgi:hypothetical protein